MSRVANNPVQLPKGVEANFTATQISVKGSKGNLELALHEAVEISKEGDVQIPRLMNDPDLSERETRRASNRLERVLALLLRLAPWSAGPHAH